MTEHPSLQNTAEKRIKENAELEEAAHAIISEFKPLIESRRHLQESESELKSLLQSLTEKITELGELKKTNLELEKEVLTKIRGLL